MNAYPTTTQVVCANVVLNGRGLLLVREAKREALGRWSLPAGRLETGETLAEGAAREALEETGLIVEPQALLGIYHCAATLEGGSAISFVFRSVVVGGEIRMTPKHPEVEFVPRHEVENLLETNQIRGQHVGDAIAAADEGRELPPGLITEIFASPPPG